MPGNTIKRTCTAMGYKNNKSEPVVFIGYDEREEDAFKVCSWTIQKYASSSPLLIGVYAEECRNLGLYSRDYTIKSGVKYDKVDGKPFSTDFSFTRFLVPFLASTYEIDAQWAVFVDCDFMFMDDITKVFLDADPRYAIMVCKHDYYPEEAIKMDGQIQQAYPKKNWSSFMLWNLNHPAHKKLTVNDVNERPGSWLHQFKWLKEEHIGEIPIAWNWLEGTYNIEEHGYPKAVHYTRGGPWFKNYQDVDYAERWESERMGMEAFNFLMGDIETMKEIPDEEKEEISQGE